MSWSTTLALAFAGVALTLFFGWRGALPPDPRRGPRLAPYRFLMVLSAAFVLLMLAHLANLAGVVTGR